LTSETVGVELTSILFSFLDGFQRRGLEQSLDSMEELVFAWICWKEDVPGRLIRWRGNERRRRRAFSFHSTGKEGGKRDLDFSATHFMLFSFSYCTITPPHTHLLDLDTLLSLLSLSRSRKMFE